MATKPNVIFFMVDQMGAKWLEAAMSGICDLPNLRRLQCMGVTFTTAFSNNPVCCPARASIATGLTSRGHGLFSNGYRLNPDIPTFMKTLQTAGWRTGAFGKIHFYPFDSEYYPYPDYRRVARLDRKGASGTLRCDAGHPGELDAAIALLRFVWRGEGQPDRKDAPGKGEDGMV